MPPPQNPRPCADLASLRLAELRARASFSGQGSHVGTPLCEGVAIVKYWFTAVKNRSPHRFVPAAALLVVAGIVASPAAHRTPLQTIVYVGQVGDRLRVVVRVPTRLLGDPRLPVRADGYFDLQTALDPNSRSMAAVAGDI